MCPDPQLLSIYMDGELPSPWKEKMESHLTECSECSEKYGNLLKMREQIKKANPVQIAENAEEQVLSENEFIEKAKERIWQNLESGHNFRSARDRQINRYNVWKRRVSIPVPVAAAAALILVFFVVFLQRGGSVNNNGFASQNGENGFTLASDDTPQIIPTGDLNSVLEYLGVDRSEVIILQLPDSGNFSRSGDPAVIRSADYAGR